MSRRPPADPKRPHRRAGSASGEHPPAERWWAWAAGETKPSERRRLDAHRRGCVPCRRLATGALRLAGARGLLDLEAPPAAVRRRIRDLFETVRAPSSGKAVAGLAPARVPTFSRLRLAAGAGGFPGTATAWGNAYASATRRSGGEPLRRCALEGGAWRLELEWTPLDRAWAIRGRVVSTDAPSGRGVPPALRLESGDGRSRRMRPGPRGFFGPVRIPGPELRVTLEEGGRSFRSPWLPRAPRVRR
jgi:hypothetical protein